MIIIEIAAEKLTENIFLTWFEIEYVEIASPAIKYN